MVSERQLLIRRLLRERGPLSAEELLPLLAETGYHITSRNPKTTLANSFQNDFQLVSAGEGRWAYLPAAAEGATMLVPMPETPPQEGLVVPVEVAALLSASGVEYHDRRSGPVLL